MFAEKLSQENYAVKEKLMSVKKMNLRLFLILPALYALYTAVYLLRWDYVNIFEAFFSIFFLLEILLLAFGVFAFLAAAMILKAVFMSAFSEGKSGSLRFKIIKEIQKPHCCLTEPITVRQYRICLLVYILTVGVIPYAISFVSGDFAFVFAGFICAFFAGGDILFLIALFREKGGSYIVDFDGVMLYRIYEKI